MSRPTLQIAVVGSRRYRDGPRLNAVLDSLRATRGEFILVSGGCPEGADFLAGLWAKARGVPALIYPARWVRPDGSKNRAAGCERNTYIAQDADLVVAFWDGASPGTNDTIVKARRLGKEVLIESFPRALPRPGTSPGMKGS